MNSVYVSSLVAAGVTAVFLYSLQFILTKQIFAIFCAIQQSLCVIIGAIFAVVAMVGSCYGFHQRVEKRRIAIRLLVVSNIVLLLLFLVNLIVFISSISIGVIEVHGLGLSILVQAAILLPFIFCFQISLFAYQVCCTRKIYRSYAYIPQGMLANDLLDNSIEIRRFE